MHTFIRLNGKEVVVENATATTAEFNNKLNEELKFIFGEAFQFLIQPLKNFANPDHTDNIFNGIINGKFESETPVSISAYRSLGVDVSKLMPEEFPEADITIPAFIGFRK